VLIQLCAPRNAVLYFDSLKEKQELAKLDYLGRMNKVSDVYTALDKQTTSNNCQLKSQHARRAVSLFPSQSDCKAVLFNDKADDVSMMSEMPSLDALTFEEFMFSRECSFPPEILQAP